MSGVGLPDVRYGKQGENPKDFFINLCKTPTSEVYAKTGEKIRSGLFPGSGENLKTIDWFTIKLWKTPSLK
jgi:hypothetical protein